MDGWPPQGGNRPQRPRSDGSKPNFDIKLPPLNGVVLTIFIFVAAGVLLVLSGNHGITTLRADEIGVVVNYISGKSEIITQPGYKLYIPFVQHVYKFDQTTQQFQMEGTSYRNNNHTPLLTVRASDGSNFRIDDLTILYEMVPDSAELILHDSGPGDGFKEEWVKAYARSVLRDEFGRFTAVEVANPTQYKQAPLLATDRLNNLLGPHGINIVRINTPTPQFDVAYENAIEERKEADQEVERLIAEALRLDELRGQRLAMVSKEKEVEQQVLTGTLRQSILKAQEDQIEVMKDADVYATARIAEGTADKAKRINDARGLLAKYTKEAEGIESRAEALAQRGSVIVREALVEKLQRIRFTLVPYSRDPSPKRLEHNDARDAVTKSGIEEGN